VKANAGFLKGGSLAPCSISHLQLSLLEHALPSKEMSVTSETDGQEKEDD
jgi:hypothetical protein